MGAVKREKESSVQHVAESGGEADEGDIIDGGEDREEEVLDELDDVRGDDSDSSFSPSSDGMSSGRYALCLASSSFA